MDWKRYCYNAMKYDPPLGDNPDVYLPPPHKEYKARVINRAVLSHKDYINLLSTPKGYYFDKYNGTIERKRDRRNKKWDVSAPLGITDYRYIKNFMTDIWNVLTPACIGSLEDILITELGLNEREAKLFLEEQKMQHWFSQKKVRPRWNLSERHDWVREVSDILAGKITDYFVLMMTTPRTKRVYKFAETILERLTELTGEFCFLENPQNNIQKLQVFFADRLAVWLISILSEKDEEICRRQRIDEQRGNLSTFDSFGSFTSRKSSGSKDKELPDVESSPPSRTSRPESATGVGSEPASEPASELAEPDEPAPATDEQ